MVIQGIQEYKGFLCKKKNNKQKKTIKPNGILLQTTFYKIFHRPKLNSQEMLLSWPENQGILFFYISKTLQMIRISFMASPLNAVL